MWYIERQATLWDRDDIRGLVALGELLRGATRFTFFLKVFADFKLAMRSVGHIKDKDSSLCVRRCRL